MPSLILAKSTKPCAALLAVVALWATNARAEGPTPPTHQSEIRLVACDCEQGATASDADLRVAYDVNNGGTVCRVVAPPGAKADEYLCDGGDDASPVGVRADWSIAGLEQEDTVAHYDTLDGRTVVTPSNKVCIYAPRFAAVRQVVNPLGAQQRMFVGAVNDDRIAAVADERLEPTSSLQNLALVEGYGQDPANVYRGRQQAGEAESLVALAETIGLVGPYANLHIVHLGEIVGEERALIARSALAALTWSGDQAAQVTISGKATSAMLGASQPGVLYRLNEPNNPQLRLIKLASTDAAQPGDEVEFTLRFDNTGDTEIGNVTIVDHLTTRLEYVKETAKSTVDAEFLPEQDAGGSLVLRWEITEPLKPGEGGVLTFKVRVL
ncbi:hypothetical protein Mal64_32650 [Pseudobythopirellula maris]|uniref:DUF11 domain-containing protein n=1 Tax=Pseudobythopirellula maris TaxID=2527991 RepID=A0A5C5ZK33_9BACT|nr:DUF11 domain-containing protein [Pseudobythopirellula maris]TWT87722.1 hypothetical protein Mal64_32650 [Pseudobythopirellula maris]